MSAELSFKTDLVFAMVGLGYSQRLYTYEISISRADLCLEAFSVLRFFVIEQSIYTVLIKGTYSTSRLSARKTNYYNRFGSYSICRGMSFRMFK
jgi:hypothetical protein